MTSHWELAGMSDGTGRVTLSRNVLGTLLAFVLVGAGLLAIGRRDYPNLHEMLDTGNWLLSGILVLLLADIAARTNRPFLKWLAISFAVTAAFELIHVLVTVEWFGVLAPISDASRELRPATWPIAAYVRPIGIGWSVWLLLSRRQRAPAFAPALLLLSGLLFPLFYWLPRYTAPGWLDITRPSLMGIPLMWAVIGWTCWRYRNAEPLLPVLTLMAAVFFLSDLSMLYSRSPHDTPAMVAHLGKIAGSLTMLLSLMQMAAADMRERIRAQQAVAQVNENLERRVAERTAQLQVSYERTRAIIDTALDGLIVMDHEGRITEFSPAAERIFGYRRSEAIGLVLADAIIPAASRTQHRLGLARYLASGESKILGQRLELTALRSDGTEVPVELSICRIPGEGPPSFAGSVRDITLRRQGVAVRAQYAAIIESSEDAIIGKTLQGIITSWNPGAERLFGYTAQEAIGQPMSMLTPPDRANEEHHILAQIARGQHVEHFETVRVRKDGAEVDISASISLLKNARGETIGASKIARDVSERKRAEHKLQRQLARLDLLNQITRAIGQRQDLPSIFQVVIPTLEDELPIDFGCVCLYDAADAILTVTCVGVRSAVLAMELGLTEHARIAIDQNGLSRCVRGQLVYEPDIDQVQFPFPQRLASGGLRALIAAPLQIESKVFGVLIAARNGRQSFSSGECEFVRQVSEHVALAAHQAETHTALQQAYEDLRQTQQAVMQQERLRALGQMASGIAHDINNAISPVALYTDSLLEHETQLSPQGRGQLQIIQRAIGDVAQTVARMREFYRQRESQSALIPVQANRLVQQVLDLTRARWNDMPQQRGVVVEMRAELAAELPAFMGVESEIREALTNLIFNAVDAMAEGGTLTVRTGATAGESLVYVEVRDTGIGMDEETRRRCMEPFFTTKGERGTGLGLAMVYGVAQRHGAEIEIDSAIGQGTAIRLKFRSQNDIAPAAEVRSSSFVLPPLRILVVDDDPLVLKSLRDTLEADGHDITTANGGQEGINVFAAAQQSGKAFAIVITDLGMPHIDGRKVAGAIKNLSRSTPVILLTGWGQRLMSEGDIPPHVDQLLSKPPKLRQLREALTRCRGPGGPHSEATQSA
jgi:PAS domain S-box-containing protein